MRATAFYFDINSNISKPFLGYLGHAPYLKNKRVEEGGNLSKSACIYIYVISYLLLKKNSHNQLPSLFGSDADRVCNIQK